MNAALIALHVATCSLLDRAVDHFEEDTGQTTMEWMGIAAVVVAVLAVVLNAAPTLGETVRTAWERLFNSAVGAG